jgi:isopentenyldiphosphate isomerase
MEFLDFYDENINFLGTNTRNYVHQNNLWHKVFHCWIFDEKEKKILVQLRSKNKKNLPSKLDISAAGHFLTQETEKEASREIQEELGIDFELEELIFWEVRKTKIPQNFEFCYTYFLKNRWKKENFIIQKEEVEDLIWIEAQTLKDLFTQKIKSIQVNLLFSNQIKNITIDDFVFHAPNYYENVANKILQNYF